MKTNMDTLEFKCVMRVNTGVRTLKMEYIPKPNLLCKIKGFFHMIKIAFLYGCAEGDFITGVRFDLSKAFVNDKLVYDRSETIKS